MQKKGISIFLVILTLCFAGCSRANRDFSSGSGSAESIQENAVSDRSADGGSYIHLNANTRVLDVINNPAFKGFGQFLFSTDFREPDGSMTLNNINSLLPYHSHINTDTTVDVLNSIMDMVADKETIFYDIYTDEEKQADPSKKKYRAVFLPWEAGFPLCYDQRGRRIFLCGFHPRKFPPCAEAEFERI